MGPALVTDLLDALDQLAGGIHAGFRPAHAKGLMCSGTFHPSPEAAELTRRPHAGRPSTPVTVRYSDSTGLPDDPRQRPGAVRPARDRRPLPPRRPRPHRHRRPLHQRLPRPHRRGVPGVPARRRRPPGRASPRRCGPSSPRTPTPVASPSRPSRSRPASRGRRSSPSRPSSSPTPRVSAGTGASASGPRKGPSTSRTSRPPRSPRTSSSTRSARGWRSGPVRLGVFVQLVGDGDDVTDSSVPWPDGPHRGPLRHDHPVGPRG